MPNPSQTSDQWWVNDQTPDNPYGKSEDYGSYLDYLGALPRSLTPAIAAGTLRINVSELNDHPDYKAAAIGALQMWASVIPLKFEIVDDAPFDKTTDWMQVVSPELGEEDDGSAYSSNRYVSIGQRFHDTESNKTDIGGYVFDSFIHELGHEFGLNHPGLYNYSGPGGVQITYLNNATWTYDRQQYSVMSYFDGIDIGETTRWSPSTPLMADIEAVIRRFFSTVDAKGVRTYQHIDLNTGDNVYGFGSTQYGYQLTSSGMQHDIGFVIHDTGGTDTVDFSGSTAGSILDLRAGQFSSVNGHSNNVSIFDGHNGDGTDYYIEKGIGSRYDDVLIGNDGANVLDGRGGGDRMAGYGGDDTYFVDSLDDIVREEANGGNDTVVLLSRSLNIRNIANVENIIYADQPTSSPGGGGEPLPSAGNNTMTSGIFGDNGNNTLDGGSGDDTIFGQGGDDLIVGGRDSLASRDINNTIDVADLEDQTESDDGNDMLYGGGGNDTILGGQGNDILDGGGGDDKLSGQDGIDIFRGGAGVDTVDYSRESPFQLLVNLATNVASGGTASGDTFYSIENLIGSDDRIDRFIGTAAANHFWGRGGGDYFNGGDGNDILDGGRDGDIIYGEGGNDTIIGGSGQDYLDGGAGIDTVVYAGSSAGVTIDLANGTANGGDGDGPVQIVGRGTIIRHDILASFENAVGSSFDDHLIGNALANDLSGGAGADTLTGNAGEDSFRFSTELGADNVDRITDFNVVNDTILLDNLVFTSVGGDDALALGAFYRSAGGVAHDADDRIIYDTNDGTLSYDADGSGQAAAIPFAQLSTNLNLSSADFVII
nr:M10 family metallopeptidase C-terminal domain-containing protein [Mesorhizobium amorphae]